jgi:tryptophanyl-tRNA synthetase
MTRDTQRAPSRAHPSSTPATPLEAQYPAMQRPMALSGDRPTGPLHLGHLAGALQTRIRLQDRCQQTVLIADLQALTDGRLDPRSVATNVVDVAIDYLAAGMDPTKTTICVQSQIPELAELTILLLNLAPYARVARNPTLRSELRERGLGRSVSAGFMVYPVSQAADIAAFKADLVPTGEDQLPVIELTNALVRRFNRRYTPEEPILREARPVLSRVPRLPGIDGKAKMSKSLGNAITLRAEPDEIRRAVDAMYTDPNHLHVEDPGCVEGNVVFAHLDAFDADGACVEDLKRRYREGGVGDRALKDMLNDVLQDLLRPVRERRHALAGDRAAVQRVLAEGSARARALAAATLADVRRAMCLSPARGR